MRLRKDAMRDSCAECRMRLPRQRTVVALHERARLRCPAFKATTRGRVQKARCIGHGTCLLMLLISVALYFPCVSSARSRCLSCCALFVSRPCLATSVFRTGLLLSTAYLLSAPRLVTAELFACFACIRSAASSATGNDVSARCLVATAGDL